MAHRVSQSNACLPFAIASIALSVLVFPAISFGDDGAAKKAIISALEKLAAKDVSLSGEIKEEKPEADGNHNLIVMPGAKKKPFLGEVEILSTKNQEVAMVSKVELPGVKVYSHDEEKLCVQASESEPLSTANLAQEIEKLCNWRELADAVGNAKEITAKKKPKGIEVQVVLENSFFPAQSNERKLDNGTVIIEMGPGMNPSVADLTVTFLLNESKEIAEIEYAVQFNDPMKAMFAAMPIPPMAAVGGPVIVDRAIEAEGNEEETKEVQDVGGNFPQPIQGAIVVEAEPAAVPALPAGRAMAVQGFALPMQGDGDSVGDLVTYSFQIQSTPSKKVAKFLEEAKAMLLNRQ